MANTGIPYVTKGWNPIIGCTPVSAGCGNCWARELHNMRHKAHLDGKKMPKQYAKPFSEVQFLPERLDEPLHWRKPQRVFVCPQSDLFHEDVPFEVISEMFARMALCPQHQFLVFTKRPGRALEWFGGANIFTSYAALERCRKAHRDNNMPPHLGSGLMLTIGGKIRDWPLPNVMMLTSIEDQATAEKRIPQLLKIPAKWHGVSIEPMLGPVDMLSNLGGTLWMGGQRGCAGQHKHHGISPHDHGDGTSVVESDLRTLHHHHDDRCNKGLDLVIVGGESGKGARPMRPEWVRQVRDDCAVVGVSFYFKQWGEWVSGWLCDGPQVFLDNGETVVMHQAENANLTYPDGNRRIRFWSQTKGYAEDDYMYCVSVRVGHKLAGYVLDGEIMREVPWTEARN